MTVKGQSRSCTTYVMQNSNSFNGQIELTIVNKKLVQYPRREKQKMKSSVSSEGDQGIVSWCGWTKATSFIRQFLRRTESYQKRCVTNISGCLVINNEGYMCSWQDDIFVDTGPIKTLSKHIIASEAIGGIIIIIIIINIVTVLFAWFYAKSSLCLIWNS